MGSYPTGIICVNKVEHMSRAAGLGQKHGKFPALETKERAHGIKKWEMFYRFK